MKRILFATFLGLCMGVLCSRMLFSAGILKFTLAILIFVLLNRAVMGFAIGASGLRLHWAWNGIVMGLAVGSVFSYFLFLSTGTWMLPVINFFVNGLFGLLIEFLTTKPFRLPVPAHA